MIDSLFNILRNHPVLALFLTVGLGFFLGKLKIKGFALGSVTSVLIVGVIIGQLGIELSPQIKNIFFMLFLFSIGYSVGPKFFRSLRGMGLKQALFALCMSAVIFIVTVATAHIMGYNAGETIGMFSGSQTCSALIGVGGETIQNSTMPAADKQAQIDIMPVCYAVTYIFGTLGTIIILGTFGPKFFGGLDKVKADTEALEEEMNNNSWTDDPVNVSALQSVTYRAFLLDSPYFADNGHTVEEAEHHLRSHGKTIYIDRIRGIDGQIAVADPDLRLVNGMTVVLCGRCEYIVEDADMVGVEVTDDELMFYPVERIPVVLSSRKLRGRTVSDLRRHSYMRGVIIESITRSDEPLEVSDQTVLAKRDTITVLGRRENVRSAAAEIGYMDIPTNRTDIMFLMLAVFLGGLLGSLSIFVHSVPVSLGTSGGALIAGLVFGWLRSRRPTYGAIPEPALWLMNNLGLNVFIAVVGINSATSFVAGLQEVGVGLLLAGAVCTTLPLLIGLWMAKKLFHMRPALALGCCAGTRTCTASLGAVQENIGSTLPTMGYTVTYAVSNIMLVIWGLIAVIIA